MHRLADEQAAEAMTLAAIQHTSESAVLCELCLGGYWCPDLSDDLFSSALDRVILGVCRSLRERRFVRFGLSAVVAHVKKLRDGGAALKRLTEVVDPNQQHWWNGEQHFQFHLQRLIADRRRRLMRPYAVDMLHAVYSEQPLDIPALPQITDPTPTLMDRQWNLRTAKERVWLENKTKSPGLKLARA